MAATFELITTYLEMRDRPHLNTTPPHRSAMLLKLDDPTVSFYRYLYRTIGDRWSWRERLELSDDELAEIITDDAVDIFVLYMGGIPAGFFELDRRLEEEVELTLFGLAPEFIGRGLGKHLLAAAVEAAWDHRPVRVWVRLTNLDHPRGLLTYQWAGFEPYETRRDRVDDPRG